MLRSPINPIEIHFVPRSLIFVLERLMFILCKFFNVYSDVNLYPLSVNKLPIKFNLSDVSLFKVSNDLVN